MLRLNKKNKRQGSHKAFTLIEVMLAVTILSVGLVLIVRSFASSIRAIKVSQNLLTAQLLLEGKLWQKQEEQSREQGLLPEDEQGEFLPPREEFSYKISFEQLEGLPALYKGTFEVFWQQRRRKWRNSCLTLINCQQEEQEE